MAYSLLTEADAGHTEFTDEVFQNETRFPGGEWKPAAEPYTDVVRHAFTHRLGLLSCYLQPHFSHSVPKAKSIYAYLQRYQLILLDSS